MTRPRLSDYNTITGNSSSFSETMLKMLILAALIGGIAYGIYYAVKKSKNENFLSYKSIEKEEEAMKTHNSYR